MEKNTKTNTRRRSKFHFHTTNLKTIIESNNFIKRKLINTGVFDYTNFEQNLKERLYGAKIINIAHLKDFRYYYGVATVDGFIYLSSVYLNFIIYYDTNINKCFYYSNLLKEINLKEIQKNKTINTLDLMSSIMYLLQGYRVLLAKIINFDECVLSYNFWCLIKYMFKIDSENPAYYHISYNLDSYI